MVEAELTKMTQLRPSFCNDDNSTMSNPAELFAGMGAVSVTETTQYAIYLFLFVFFFKATNGCHRDSNENRQSRSTERARQSMRRQQRSFQGIVSLSLW
jgi:transposase